MSLNVTGSLDFKMVATEAITLGGSTTNNQVTSEPTMSFTNGSGSGQINQHFEASGATSVTLAASASTTITLSGLTDAAGRTVPFTKVRGFLLWVTSRQAGDYLTVGDPTASLAHPLTSILGGATQSIKVWDFLGLGAGQTDGYAVASGTADQLKVTNSGANPITFSYALFGV